MLFDKNHHEVKLTKKEKKLINILVKSKKQFVSSDILEYTIWEDESMKYDCKGRFKVLLNGLRKKLPKYTIINSYGLGYKIQTVQQELIHE
jgi:DNA-binding response OmpR family regulator